MTRAGTTVSYTYDADGMRTGKTVTHTHSYTGEVTEPTCTEQGYTTYTCSCGDSYDITIAALGHDFGPNGREIYCLRCGADRYEIVLPPITPIIPPIGEIADLQGGIPLYPTSTEVSAYSYIYNGGQLTQLTVATETTANGSTTTASHTLTFTYDATGNPQTVDYDGTLYYYTVNLQGDVIAILDENGTAVVSYTYDAWGSILSTTGTLAKTLGKHNPLRYRGYVYDTETQLYYLQSRYYNPQIGRFMNADILVSTGQGLLGNNMFAYCGNNPVMCVDPAGYRMESNPFVLFEPIFPYITNQKDSGVGELRFGASTVAHSGCSAVATYNALLSMGVDVQFDEVLEWYNDNITQMLLLGVAGALPGLVAEYFSDHGYAVIVTDDLAMIDYLSTTADACIMWYLFGEDDFPWVGGHFFEYSRTLDEYVGRNVYGGRWMFTTPSDFAYIDKRFYAKGIFVFKRKGY